MSQAVPAVTRHLFMDMKSNLVEYIKEREGKSALETDKGFAIYEILGKECYLQDLYINPDYRRTGEARKLLNEVSQVAIKAGCEFITTTVSVLAKNPTISTQAILSCNFIIHSVKDNMIYFYKELNNG